MDKAETLARLISKYFHGYFVPVNCWSRDLGLSRLKKRDKLVCEGINKEHAKDRKFLIESCKHIIKELDGTGKKPSVEKGDK